MVIRQISFQMRPNILLLIALILGFSFPVVAQTVDTIFAKDKVILKSNIVTVLSRAEFEALKLRKPFPDTGIAKKASNIDSSIARRASIIPLSTNRPTNACGVTASFTPSNDTTLNPGSLVILTNTSTNATSYKWLVNGFVYQTQPDIYTWLNVGVYDFALVAINGTCSDTMKVLIVIYGDAPTDFSRLKVQYGLPGRQDEGNLLAACPGGGYLLAGTTNHPMGSGDRFYPEAILVRIKEQGCIEWSRSLDLERISKVHRILVTRDSGFILSISGASPFSRYNCMLMRLDKYGNTVWIRSYFENNNSYLGKGLVEASDGSIVVVAENSTFNSFSVFKIDAQGNLIWNREFTRGSNLFTLPNNITIKGNFVYVTGYLNLPNSSSEYNYDGMLLKIDLITGNEIWTKSYDAGNGSNFFQDVHVMGNQLLVNDLTGHYLGGSDIRQLLHYIDEDGNPVRGYIVRWVNHQSDGPVFSNLVPLSDGKFYIFHKGTQPLPLQPLYSNRNFFIKTDTNQNIYWQYNYWHSNYARLYQAVRAPNDGIAAIGMEVGELFKYFSSWGENMALLRSDSAGRALEDYCFTNYTEHLIEPINTTVANFQWPFSGVKNVRDTPITLYPYQLNTELRFGCPTYISKCSFLEVTGPDKLCELSQTYTFRTKKDRMCGEPVAWEFDPSMRVITQSDTMVQVQFTRYGNYFIKARLPYSCTPMSDSIPISVAPRLELLNLGRDTTICPRDSFPLRAGKDFMAYRWHDGSTDSLFKVKVPGLYYVEVTDSCGNKKTDSILVSPAAPLYLNIGPDRSKCNADFVEMVAPPGFANYTWIPNYSLQHTGPNTVNLFPAVDTSYVLRVEDAKGCYGLDTVFIKVNRSNPIRLGNDTSFCNGNSIILDAGSGFQQYQWSNGSSNQQITTATKGIYSVIATDVNSCRSFDTLEIRNVFANPVINLLQDSLLCMGDNQVLDAGAGFIQYNWSDGSSGPRITVSAPGTYWVNVIDANNCTGGDTTTINRLLPIPGNFLPADTSICTYGKLTLIPSGNFQNYNWSNGSISSTITIDKPGTYSLTVTDKEGCRGTDIMVIGKKDCLQGFYVPNAFTPNRDRNNETFKPLLFGNVKQYRFTIYNRYGQRIFETTELGKGWDGTVAGLQQNSGTYVWACTYQFENETVKTEKGTVMLIR